MLNKEKIEQLKKSLSKGVTYKSVPQLFQTPPHLATRMVNLLNLNPGDSILEPQAGTGSLLNACESVKILKGRRVAVEIDSDLAEALESSYGEIEIFNDNFLELNPNTLGKFDKIIMNPPFKNLQDIDHILHAFTFLKEGGDLVSISSESPFFNQRKKAGNFLEFLESQQASSWKLPRETFKSSGTLVSTRLIHIKKVRACNIC